jgi:hypothetical protein
MVNSAMNLKLRRLGSATIDILLIPALVGVLIGLLLHNMADAESDLTPSAVPLLS